MKFLFISKLCYSKSETSKHTQQIMIAGFEYSTTPYWLNLDGMGY